jgi:hypothetical protein
MSTVITTTPGHAATNVDVEASPQLWRAYRRRRALDADAARGRVATEVLAAAGIPRGERDRLHRALLRREAERGLSPGRAEREEDDAADAAVEDARPEPEPGSADQIEGDALRAVVELRARIERRAPEAISDPKAGKEQEHDEAELAAAERRLENVTRARVEVARRVESAEQEGERELREQADRQAQALVPAIAARAADVDARAAEWSAAVVAYRDAVEQRAAFVAAATGGDVMATRGARFRPEEVAGALRAATRGHVRLTGLEAGPRDSLLVPEREG